MIEEVTIGPLACHFTNRNREMGLRAHSHLAHVYVTWRHRGLGYPSFEDSNRQCAEVIRTALAHPVEGTNEQVCRGLFQALHDWRPPGEWHDAGDYWLHSVHLDVRGVPDALGHDDGFTRYTVTADA